jgi:hypothetical protein
MLFWSFPEDAASMAQEDGRSTQRAPKQTKVFCFFFSKKKKFLLF